MQQKDDSVRVILTSENGQFRIHYEISREAYNRALELMKQEKEPISDDRRTELFYQAMEEFPPKE